MSGIAQFAASRTRLAWALVVLASIIAGWGVSELVRLSDERERMTLLQTEAERSSFEMMSQTLNGNMMGALGALGLIDKEVKREAKGGVAPNSASTSSLLESLTRTNDADGAYIVGEDGVIKSSWGGSKSLTGVDVRFRPYFQMATKGKGNVYAAIGTTTGKRTLYFAVPLYAGNTIDMPVIGAVVARTGLIRVDKLLAGHADLALLLSPQGVVFASSRAEWIGYLAGQPSPERLKAIRELKQFGNMFENRDPALLPVAVDPGVVSLNANRYAVARAKVQWNDPFGDWTLVLMEDLARSVPVARRFQMALAGALGALLLGLLLLQILRGQHAQSAASMQLQAQAKQQELLARRKTQQAEASLKFQQAATQEALAQTFLNESHRILGMLQGTVYVVDASKPDQLHLAAGYGCAADVPAEVSFGDGLLGQCALEGKPILIEAPSPAYWRISSGLGETMPRMVVLMPILRNEAALGVAELAVLHPLDADGRTMLDDLLPLVALNLEVLLRNHQAEEMAAASLAADRKLERMAEVERFNLIAQGREQRIIELKHEANDLCRALGQPPHYESAEMANVFAEVDEFIEEHGDSSALASPQKPLALGDLVDLGELQVLFSNFCEAVGVAAAIIDLDGKVLASSRWQRACTDFHRVNSDSCARCIESDTELALKLKDGSNFTMYRCKNGMTDCASPIIVEGQHLANVFIGQFHLGPPDLALFRQQARQFDYPEAEYLKAIGEAPVMDEKRLPMILGFLTGFARMVATMSLARHRADDAQRRLQREHIAVLSLAEDADQARRALESR